MLPYRDSMKKGEDIKLDLGQVFTNSLIANYMVKMLGVEKQSNILDPCFGDGAFIKAALDFGYYNISGCEIDSKLYVGIHKKYPKVNLFNCDFLSLDEKIKYKAIIMNPPYVRQEKINDLALLGITKESLRQNSIYNVLPAKANLYMYFIIKAINILEDKGTMVVIFPGSWLKTDDGDTFKKAIQSECTITDVRYVKGRAFESNAIVEVIILRLKKEHISYITNVSHICVNEKTGIGALNISGYNGLNLDFKKKFCEFANIRRGITTGANKLFINPPVPNEDTKKIISSPKDVNGFFTDDASTDRMLWLCGEPKNNTTKKYLEKCKNEILVDKKPKTLYNKVLNGQLWYKINIFDCKGIIFNYFIRNNVKFINNSMGRLVRDNFYIITPKIDQYAMMSLLNNYYTFYQLENMGKLYGAGLLKLQRYDVEKLMFPSYDGMENRDKEMLRELGKKITLTGENDIIDEISQIISKYANIDYKYIKDAYSEVKRRRLNNAN